MSSPGAIGAKKRRSPVASSMSWRESGISPARREYSRARPVASAVSSSKVWRSTCSWNSRTAIRLETIPDSATPIRKIAGSRNLSDRNMPAAGRLGAHRLLAGRDLVADPPHGHDRRRLAELPAKLAHVDVHGARVPREGVAPDALEQLVARKHEPLVVEQLPEQVELLRRELHLLGADANLAPPGVDDELAVAHHLLLALPALGRRAAQDRLDAGDELPRVERLRHVVVRADLEPDDLVHVLVAGGEHQDRDVPALPQPARQIDPVHVGEHEVEQDQGDRGRLELLDRLRARGGRSHLVPGVLEIQRDERRDRRLVLDDQDGLGAACGHSYGSVAPRPNVSPVSGSDLNRPPLSENTPSKPPTPLIVPVPWPTAESESPFPFRTMSVSFGPSTRRKRIASGVVSRDAKAQVVVPSGNERVRVRSAPQTPS